MDKIRVKGRLINLHTQAQAEIELSPLELLEQIPHKQIGELLKMINLPQPEPQQEYCICNEPHLLLTSTANYVPNVCYRCGKPLSKKPLPNKPPQKTDLPEEIINCTLPGLYCHYAKLTGTSSMCSYKKFCDYQLPRDSRTI